jgi:CysZ protein
MSLRALLAAVFGAVSDVAAGPLRGLALLAALIAIPLLAAAAAGAIAYLIPLIPSLPGPFGWLTGLVKLIADLGAIGIGVLLWPAVSMFIGGALFDLAAERVERLRFPADPPGKPARFADAMGHALSTALPTLGLNLLALPFLLIPPLGIAVFFILNAHLISRDFFTLAALRFRPRAEVKALRKRHGRALFAAGLTCAALLYFPLLNVLAPLYGAALMVRLNKAMGAISRI